ncbi:MAG: HepT-like ribonuclease domain-containing protein [Phycisphaeraceae bacterium]
MLDHARQTSAKVRSIERAGFDADENLRLAVTHLIQIIGEAASKVSRETRQRIPDVPWRQITAMRNILVHDYMGVDFDVVWQVAKGDLPDLIAALETHN